MIKKLAVVLAIVTFFAFVCGVAPVSAKTTHGHETPAKVIIVTKPTPAPKAATVVSKPVVRSVARANVVPATNGALCFSYMPSGSQVYTTQANGLYHVTDLGMYYIGTQFDFHQYTLAYCDTGAPVTSYNYSVVTTNPAMQKYIGIGGCTTITVGINGGGYTCGLPSNSHFIVQTNAPMMASDNVVHPQTIAVTVTLQSNDVANAPVLTMPLTINYYKSWS